MFNIRAKQVILLIGLAVILISIPFGVLLIQQTQIFGPKAAQNPLDSLIPKQVSSTIPALHEVPATSPLNDLKKFLEGTSSPTPTEPPKVSFGPTLNLELVLEGRPQGKYASTAFVGIASGQPVSKPTYLLSFSLNIPDSGVYNDLNLAGLNTNQIYTAYIKTSAQIATSSAFTLSPAENNLNGGQSLMLLSGDLNDDNTINFSDYTIAKTAFGSKSGGSKWNQRADLNLDGSINNLDLSYIAKNMGKIGASGTWYSPPATSSAIKIPLNSNVGGYSDSSPSGYLLLLK